ncbi:two component system sensor kinase of tetrathionate reductase complex [Proteus mirabilis]|nr:two component system sensor kinase of tetrathionate reductase complex [Proteus mirabilis]
MDNEGLINKEDYRPLLNYSTNTSCLTSTPLYPNWSFAALDTVPDTLVDKVTRTLLNDESDAMKWGAPASHSQVENLLREVNQHPRQRQLWQDAKFGLSSTVLLSDYHWVPLSYWFSTKSGLVIWSEDVAIN